MKKMIFSLSLMLCASFSQVQRHDCNDHDQHMMSSKSDSSPSVFLPTEAGYVDPDSVHGGVLVVKPMEVKGFEGASAEKLNKAFDVVEQVVNSQEFKNRVINFKNAAGKRSFASNNNLTNEQIYVNFMEGKEKLQPDTAGEMNYYVTLYYKRWSKVVGWTNGSINTINVNWKFFQNYKPNDVAGNLAHEWLHKIGYDHKSAAEHDSAPYAIGYIVRELGARVLKGEELH